MWLKGSTTWLNCVDDLIKLIAGEIPDGQSNTVPLADRWIRETAGQNFLRSPASEDQALPDMSNRQGYWALSINPSITNDICRQTTIYSGVPSGVTNNRWIIGLRVNGANSVAGNYSTATV